MHVSSNVHSCLCVCVYLPGGGGLGPDCNDNGEEFKWDKKGDQGRLQGGWKRLWHYCYSFSLSFCLSISLLQILRSLSFSLLTGTFLKKSLCLLWFYPYLYYLPLSFSLVNVSLILTFFIALKNHQCFISCPDKDFGQYSAWSYSIFFCIIQLLTIDASVGGVSGFQF